MPLHMTAAPDDPDLLFLPWHIPLEEWSEDQLVALPRGISRHVVRFVKVSNTIIAVKEIKAEVAVREYNMLRFLNKIDQPCVQPFGVVSGRVDANGEELFIDPEPLLHLWPTQDHAPASLQGMEVTPAPRHPPLSAKAAGAVASPPEKPPEKL